MYIKREIEKEIEPFLARPEAISIIGSRQAGKTTLLKYLKDKLEKKITLKSKDKKSVKYINFEKRSDLELFQNSINDFKDLIKKYKVVIIDEFQYAKDGGQKLKYLYDETNIKFIISGSSSLELTFQTGKYMVGRLINFTLYPFSFLEYLSFTDLEIHELLKERIGNIFSLDFKINKSFGFEVNQRLEKLFFQYLTYGGYPAVVLSKNDQVKQKILENLFNTYLLKDVKSLLQLATDDELVKLVKYLATQIGSLISYKELSNNANLNHKSLIKHLEILRKTYIIDLIKPYFKNKQTELSKNPKPYFIDLGLRNYSLTNFKDYNSLTDDLGYLVENYVYLSLQRNSKLPSNVNFWRTKSGAEVDFVIENNGGLLPIEVKYSNNPQIGKSLYSFINKFSPKEAYVLNRGFVGEKMIEGCRIKFVPVYYV